MRPGWLANMSASGRTASGRKSHEPVISGRMRWTTLLPRSVRRLRRRRQTPGGCRIGAAMVRGWGSGAQRAGLLPRTTENTHPNPQREARPEAPYLGASWRYRDEKPSAGGRGLGHFATSDTHLASGEQGADERSSPGSSGVQLVMAEPRMHRLHNGKSGDIRHPFCRHPALLARP